MITDILFKNRRLAAKPAGLARAESPAQEDCDPAIIFIDLGISGLDGWVRFQEVDGRLVACQDA